MLTTVYLSNPFERYIIPGDVSGLKLYIFPTADRQKEDLLTILQENVTNIMSVFRYDLNSFGWGMLTKNITKAVGDPLHILEDFQACKLVLFRKETSKI